AGGRHRSPARRAGTGRCDRGAAGRRAGAGEAHPPVAALRVRRPGARRAQRGAEAARARGARERAAPEGAARRAAQGTDGRSAGALSAGLNGSSPARAAICCRPDKSRGPTTMTPVRWGILSTAAIGTQRVIPGMLKSRELVVAAIASRELAKAQAAATSLGIPVAHGSYEALFADPSIEVVYNPLPNHLHVPMTLAALQAGKHVLCEKPMAMNAAELEVLRPYAGRLHVREAFMVRHHPQWIAARDAVRGGAIGEARYIQVPFSYFNDDPANVRNKA